MNSAYIGQLTVRSQYPYIVYGSVRGLVSEHRTLAGAERGAQKDLRDCADLSGDCYSDARVYRWDGSDWEDIANIMAEMFDDDDDLDMR